MKTRILLTTGGTGGHVFPALAVAEQLRRLAPHCELLFVGSQYGPESQLAATAGIPFRGLSVRGVLGRGWRSATALAGMGKAIFTARSLVREFAPTVVAGFGAYASIPSLVAARFCRIPVAIHEQNAVPGVSNRLMGRLASRIFLSLPDTKSVFPAERCTVTGNPVREAMAALGDVPFAPVENRRPRLLITGGSQGAKAINSVILASLKQLMDVDIRHQTGEPDLQRVQAGLRGHGHDGQASAFITNMAEAYGWADVVLCRSGASTVAELAVCGKPSVLVPFPFATHDHQTGNAQALVRAGAARMVAEKDIPHTDMPALLRSILFNNQTLADMSLAARACACRDAATQVATGILELSQRKGVRHA